MTLQQLKYIVTVAECGSISEAAKALFISQPSLSKAIREIEQRVDKMLFLRTPKGMVATDDGLEFLGYARQVLQQMDVLEEKYTNEKVAKRRFSVSMQHYTFAADAFVELVKTVGDDAYEFALFEGPTKEILDNVKNMKSDLGIIYLSEFNKAVIRTILRENNLEFTTLLMAKPHAFLYRGHPLASRDLVRLEELERYPCVTYDQRINNSFYFSEEILSAREMKKHVIVTDRAALVNLLIGLNAYTIGTGVMPSYLHGSDIISVPLDSEEYIEVGIVQNRDCVPGKLAELYLESLRQIINEI